MQVKVTLVYEDHSKDRELTVTIKDGQKGARLLNSVERAVEKAAADDKAWVRWNLVSIIDPPKPDAADKPA